MRKGSEEDRGEAVELEEGIVHRPRRRYGRRMSKRSDAIAEAERAGFDLSLVDESLSLSYDQRALQHQEALNLVLELEAAGRKLRERPESADPAAL